MTTIMWFRADLRLTDHPALVAAAAEGAVVPVFVWAPEEERAFAPGGASRWWLHHGLAALAADLRRAGSRLILRRAADSLAELLRLARECGADRVVWSRRYEPAAVARDSLLKTSLRAAGLAAESYNAALLREPWEVRNKSGAPFQVFTPFWRHCVALGDPPAPLDAPVLDAPARWPASLELEELDLRPRIAWDEGLREAWQPGSAAAAHRLREFVHAAFADYAEARNRPDLAATSRLSPHLHFGEIGPREIWHALRTRLEAGRPDWRQSQFVAELGWREFAHHLLFHFPSTPSEPLRAAYGRFPWRDDPAALAAWQRGLTGYPIVDAGMRELWRTGWMHNRVRMIVASFLVKDLLLPWSEGARWFWDTLVDADLAANTLGWQWVAGCGADAAPYFRIFNPVGQGMKFDPNGDYVRRYVPELARLPSAWIHRPWEAPAEILSAAGVDLGRHYPKPIVDHAAARGRALLALASLNPAH
ncbi:MAG: deoxyribodipyrimidine photo-lyase [Gammaproteobacteria bacterium]|nr:deoxyribodipyrimidine photo-lyase [Gammaproteobacteria bacterium]